MLRKLSASQNSTQRIELKLSIAQRNILPQLPVETKTEIKYLWKSYRLSMSTF